tara:strand:- start:4316 stop:4573 length:258 start_codon:yes stop_codon:yes gene_type:complete
MRSWPIWIDVEACTYKSSKSYGARDTNSQTINVGSSASNSHELVKICTTRKEEGDEIVFRFGVDGKVIKTLRMDKNTHEIKREES